NHVAANFVMAMILLLGFMTWGKLKKEIFPETSIDAIMISVPYPNATPEEVEKGIIVPIEETIQDIEGIDRIRSTADQGSGNVQVDVENGFNTRNVMDDIKTRVDAIQNLAEEAEKPLLTELLIKAQVMSIAVSAETDERTLREIAEQVSRSPVPL
ncbi:efflux RND transporter permease subunit, partial [Verrucomicrobiales bacterium]|nr:efflux RND transporter permease subunit [Verrucomicrobiales bacterium]